MPPAKLNLTPASDGTADHARTATASPTVPGHFSQRLGTDMNGGNSTPALSSTCASVDSDSDYQDGGANSSVCGSDTASTIGGGAPSSTVSTNGTGASRPLSRTSTMSGLSMTATKDGVEGNRIHRSHDPQGYTNWASSALLDQQQQQDQDQDADMAITPTSTSGFDDPHAFDDGMVAAATPPSVTQTQLLADQPDSPIDYAPTPPNHPSAPPITLTEKIRLLRTGSVSRKGSSVAAHTEV